VRFFVYPDKVHVRSENPPQFTDYRHYKPFLRREFSRRCVYCLLPDGIKGAEAFGCEHYAPKKRFSARETLYTNLLYACNVCNSRKGNYWPSAQQRAQGCYVLNPCLHTMAEHVRYKRCRARHRSETGLFFAELLDLNEDGLPAYRLFLLRTYKRTRKELSARRRDLVLLRREMKRQPPSARALELNQAIRETEQDIHDLEADLTRFV
jgi:hypothetical protein